MEPIIFCTFHLEPDFFNDLLVNIVGVFLGSGVTIGLYYLSTKSDKKKEHIRRKQEKNKEEEDRKQLQRENILYFKSLVTNSIDNIRLQIQNFNKLDTEIKLKPEIFPILDRSLTTDIERLVNKVDQAVYFHSYLETIKGNNNFENFKEIYTLLDYYNATYSQIDSICKTAVEKDNKFRNEYARLLTESQDKIGIFLDTTKDAKIIEIITEITTPYFNHTNKGSSDITFHHNEYVSKLFHSLGQSLDYNLENKEVLTIIRDLYLKYQDVLILIDDFGKGLGAINIEFAKYLTILEEKSKSLRSWEYKQDN